MMTTKKKRETQRIHWSWRASYHGSLDDFSEDENPEVLYLIGQLADYCESFCFQLESAETGYLHFQGCLQLINKRRKHDILRKIHPFEYLAPNKGTPKQAWHYCSKDETRLYGPWFIGAPQILDVKEKLADFVDACQQPDITERDLWLKYPSMMTRYPHTYYRVNCLVKPVRTEPLEVYIFYGGPGSGKSRMVEELYPDAYIVPWSQKTWLTPRGYKAKVVVFQDFTGEMYLKQFNRYVDRYAEEVEYKGGYIWWLPTIILITTNVLPSLWYKTEGRQDVLNQVYRRITACYDFTDWDYDRDWPNRILPPAYSCQELSDKYLRTQQNFNNQFIGLNKF